MWVEFLMTSFIVVIAPGTGVIYVIGVGLSRGAGASLAAATGCTFGILPHMTAAILGLAALLHTSALLFHAVKWFGIAYLLYLAWSIMKEDGPIQFEGDADKGSLVGTALTGFLINILNPKLSLFFMAFLPQFVPAQSSSPFGQMLLLSGIFMAMTFVVFMGYGVFAGYIRTHIEQRPAILVWMKRSFSAAFLLLGIRLAFEGR
ncbi:MAG TPA: lysine transporter LysE [Rhizobiales bacterium]|nr:lysine transporter LysE [Hyphomicrobiales bacterium]